MNAWMRRVVAVSPLACSLVLCGATQYAMAQESTENGPPKVLVIDREVLKPGKAGMVHEKAEAAFVRAMSSANSNMHYFALTSMTGPSRALFLMGFPSFAAWEEENKAVEKNATLTEALDRATEADGELLTNYERGAWLRRDDLTVNPGPLKGYRYMELFLMVVPPGHMKDWNELAKMYVDAYKKATPEVRFVVYQQMYGTSSAINGAHGQPMLIITPMKSMAEVDNKMAVDQKVMEAIGEEHMKHAMELDAMSVADTTVNLFAISPKMSYPVDALVKADPDFWKPAPMATGGKKNAAAKAP